MIIDIELLILALFCRRDNACRDALASTSRLERLIRRIQ